MMQTGSLEADALQRLATVSPKELTKVTTSGKRLLHSLFLGCANARLCHASGIGDDLQRLHALFDVALNSGLGSLIQDYVLEVCSDRSFTSSDALEAHLLDGECVSNWCRGTLEQSLQHMQHSLSHGLKTMLATGGLQNEAARLKALILVLRALAQPGQEDQRIGSGVETALEQATRLQQCVLVLEWAGSQGLHNVNACGRYSSRQEWQLVVNKRRDAAQPSATFLQDLLSKLAQHGVHSLQYPPGSVEQTVQMLFLEGGTDEAAWSVKLAAFLYFLLDAGHKATLPAFRRAFSVGPQNMAQWHVQFLLDEAALQQSAATLALDTACSIIEGATASLPFKFVEALAARGRPLAALSILRARGRACQDGIDSQTALREALTALSIRLQCSMLTEAYIEAQHYLEGVASEERAEHTSALIRQLAAWAAGHRALHSVVQLPLLALEEQALIEWLGERRAAGDPAGDFLPLYLLLRGRLPEALHAHAQLLQLPRDAPSEILQRRAILQELLSAAAELLPWPQKSPSLHPDPPGQPGASLTADTAVPGAATVPLPPLLRALVGHALRGSSSEGMQESTEDAGVAKEGFEAALLLAGAPGSAGALTGVSLMGKVAQGTASSFGEPAASSEGREADVDDDWNSFLGVPGKAGVTGSKRPGQPLRKDRLRPRR